MNQNHKSKTSFRVYNQILTKSENPGLNYLELIYEVTEMTLNKAQLEEDWDRQVRFKSENKIRDELTKLNKEAGKINTVKFNLRKKELNNKLDRILSQKKGD